MERLRVDPIACDAFGYCAELLPEMVWLDEWGYPVIDEAPVPPHLLEEARAAVRACPRKALALHRFDGPPRAPRSPGTPRPPRPAVPPGAADTPSPPAGAVRLVARTTDRRRGPVRGG